MTKQPRVLIPATDGPCAGHPCDNCATCRHGRCCKRDHEGYHLPDEGAWDGPIFGRIGVRNYDGNEIECHICGGWYQSLGHHIMQHDVTAAEYRALFGLKAKTPLVTEAISARFRQLAFERGINVTIADYRRTYADWTPEQREEMNAHRYTRRETLLDPGRRENMDRFNEASRSPEVRRRAVKSFKQTLADPAVKARRLARMPQCQPRWEEVACCICGAAKLMKPGRAKLQMQHVCADPACYAELQRRRVQAQGAPSQSLEARAKISASKKGHKLPPRIRLGTERNCQQCGASFYAQPHKAARLYCSRACVAAARVQATDRRATCIHGHAWTAENIYFTPQGERQCRECRRSSSNR